MTILSKTEYSVPLAGGVFASIGHSARSLLTRAVGAAEERPVGFHPMAYDLAAAMRAFRSHRLNCTFKAIEDVRLARRRNLEGFVIFISTGFTACHFGFLL
jgi:hypothetical protein